MNSVVDHASHTPYSDPGRYATLIEDVPIDPASLSTVARNVIVHYRASGHELPDESRDDINARWLEDMLALDQGRHPRPLVESRPVTQRVQGCCRDHTLFCLGVLRSHGVPARSRVGFAGYFIDGWNHDHVIVEAWLEGQWQRFDPEIEGPRPSLLTPTNIGQCAIGSGGFVTAAQVWAGYRRGEVDAETYGVDPTVPILRGERFICDEVIYEVAHRFGDELLLWDGWGRIGEPGEPVSDRDAAWIDRVAELLLASDQGDTASEQELFERYRADDGLHPGPVVIQASPYGDPPTEANIDQRQKTHRNTRSDV